MNSTTIFDPLALLLANTDTERAAACGVSLEAYQAAAATHEHEMAPLVTRWGTWRNQRPLTSGQRLTRDREQARVLFGEVPAPRSMPITWRA